MPPTPTIRIGIVTCSLGLAGLLLSAAKEDGPTPGPADPAQPSGQRGQPPTGDPRPEPASRKGLILNTGAAFPGYTLFAPLNSTTTYLVDMKGEVAHSWPSQYEPGQAVYLLDDGSLLRCAREPDNQHFGGGGIGGRVERLAPDGKVLWQFVYADEHHCLHHDIEPLPNGNVLMIAWEKKTRDEAIAAGRDPQQISGDEFWPDSIIEVEPLMNTSRVEPQGVDGGKIVWEWHVWDHLVQGLYRDKPNYGAVAEHPELVDLNFQPRQPRETPDEMRRLRALGYVGGREAEDEPGGDQGGDRPGNGPQPRGPGGPWGRSDWCHTNSIAYNAKLDQIALSVHNFNEIWVIDHGTTTQEAAGHTGGRYGKGGDLLYRWGNPQAYDSGEPDDQQLYAQHDARWIPDGLPGAGHLLVFNNGTGRSGGDYSSIAEIAPPRDSSGHYALNAGEAFGPAKPSWEYVAEDREEFFSSHISGAERLPNGNTLVCSGEQGRMFEVDAAGRTVWDYVNPYQESLRRGFGGGPPGDGSRPQAFGDGPPPRADGRRRPFPPDGQGDGDRLRGPRGGRPDGPFGPRGRGPAGRGGPPGGGVFRASRLALDDPGVQKLLAAKPAQKGNAGEQSGVKSPE